MQSPCSLECLQAGPDLVRQLVLFLQVLTWTLPAAATLLLLLLLLLVPATTAATAATAARGTPRAPAQRDGYTTRREGERQNRVQCTCEPQQHEGAAGLVKSLYNRP